MEFIIFSAIVVVLLICLGVSLETIAVGFLMFIAGAMALVWLFFVYSLIRFLTSEKKEGHFTKTEKSEKAKFESAYYLIDEGEFPNVFPCEVILRDKFYKPEKKIKLRYDKKRGRVFDRNATITIFSGIILSAVLPVMISFIVLK